MSGITGLGTTYTLPNYTGELIQLTPSDTPFLSAIGGLDAGSGQTTSTKFEWETYDLRAADQNVALEGADAPTPEERVRANVSNICQIHQEAVAISYSKLAAVGQKSGINNAEHNPITNEVDFQVNQALKQIANDVEYSFINGRFQDPSDNTTKRQTRGLRQAITTNVTNEGTAIGTGLSIAASTDKVTATAHGVSNGARVYLRNISVNGTGLKDTIVYYLVNTATNDFKLSLTSGGAAVDVLVDCTADAYIIGSSTPDPDVMGGFLQGVFDNGGISETDTATLMLGSTQKLALSKAYANAYGKYTETSRMVGGVAVKTVETDFGTLNTMLSRNVPKHEIVVVSLEQCRPVFLETPGKGHMFVEPLAKTGASERFQMYGETGLAYGSERAHGVLTGLAIG